MQWYKQDSDAGGSDYLTTVLYDYQEDPVWAEGGDAYQSGAPAADAGNGTGWGLNNQWRATADAICDLDSRVTVVEGKAHEHSNKTELDKVTDGDHDVRTDNPHSTTKTHIGLSNVTNDAQLKRAASDFQAFTIKNSPVAADILLIEDSEAADVKKYCTIAQALAATDKTRIQDGANTTYVDCDETANTVKLVGQSYIDIDAGVSFNIDVSGGGPDIYCNSGGDLFLRSKEGKGIVINGGVAHNLTATSYGNSLRLQAITNGVMLVNMPDGNYSAAVANTGYVDDQISALDFTRIHDSGDTTYVDCDATGDQVTVHGKSTVKVETNDGVTTGDIIIQPGEASTTSGTLYLKGSDNSSVGIENAGDTYLQGGISDNNQGGNVYISSGDGGSVSGGVLIGIGDKSASVSVQQVKLSAYANDVVLDEHPYSGNDSKAVASTGWVKGEIIDDDTTGGSAKIASAEIVKTLGGEIDTNASNIASKLAIADIDDTPADDADTALSSQYLYRLMNSRCSVYLSANQTINTGTETTIEYNTKNFDPLGIWDNTTNYCFTPIYNGWYWICAKTRFISLSDQDSFYLLINNDATREHYELRYIAKNASGDVSGSRLLYVTTGDKIYIRCGHDHGSDIDIRGNNTISMVEIFAVELDL